MPGAEHSHGQWAVRSALLVVAAGLVAGCAISGRSVADPIPAADRLRAGGGIQAEVDRLVRPLVDRGQVQGMVVGVLTPDGLTRTYGYGHTDSPSGSRPPAGDTLFQVGSVSKAFVAALFQILVNEGRLHYDDTVRDILPANVRLSADAEALTLYELVTHTAGLPRQPNNLIQARYFLSYLFTGQNLYGYLTREYLYEYLRTCRLEPRADRGYAYSNVGFGLLAHLIEVKTGRSLSDLVAEKISRPLRMRDTGFVLDEEQRRRLAVGHVGDQPLFMRRNTPMPPWDLGKIMRGVGGLYTTVDDLLIFAQAQLGMSGHELGVVVASTQRVQLRTPVEDVAFGWVINKFDEGRLSITYIHGLVAGYAAYIGMDVDRGIAVVVLANNCNLDDPVGHNLLLRLAAASAPVGPPFVSSPPIARRDERN